MQLSGAFIQKSIWNRLQRVGEVKGNPEDDDNTVVHGFPFSTAIIDARYRHLLLSSRHLGQESRIGIGITSIDLTDGINMMPSNSKQCYRLGQLQRRSNLTCSVILLLHANRLAWNVGR